MSRVVLVCVLALGVAACALPPERTPIRPLPDETVSLPFAELLTRARIQASNATEAFYLNKWEDLEDAARGLEQTARVLPKAIEVPPPQKEKLSTVSTALRKDAVSLREAAKAHNVKDTNEAMQRVNLTVRELRLDK
jgi:hypothetical protein